MEAKLRNASLGGAAPGAAEGAAVVEMMMKTLIDDVDEKGNAINALLKRSKLTSNVDSIPNVGSVGGSILIRNTNVGPVRRFNIVNAGNTHPSIGSHGVSLINGPSTTIGTMIQMGSPRKSRISRVVGSRPSTKGWGRKVWVPEIRVQDLLHPLAAPRRRINHIRCGTLGA